MSTPTGTLAPMTSSDDERVFVPCGRCLGDGVVHYGRVVLARRTETGGSVEDRFCFWCGGDGGKWSTVGAEAKKERAREAARARREKKRAAEREANLVAFAAQAEEIPGLDEALLFGSEIGHGLLVDLGLKTASYGRLSDAQVDLVLRVAAEAFEALIEEEAKPAPVAVPEGRVEITGTLRSQKFVENTFAPGGAGSWKGVVEDDRGFRVYGTIPGSLDVQVGGRLTFTATVERSSDDETFGFYKRPTKAREI